MGLNLKAISSFFPKFWHIWWLFSFHIHAKYLASEWKKNPYWKFTWSYFFPNPGYLVYIYVVPKYYLISGTQSFSNWTLFSWKFDLVSEIRVWIQNFGSNNNKQASANGKKNNQQAFCYRKEQFEKKHHYSHIENYGWVSCMYVCGPCHRNPTSSRPLLVWMLT